MLNISDDEILNYGNNVHCEIILRPTFIFVWVKFEIEKSSFIKNLRETISLITRTLQIS